MCLLIAAPRVHPAFPTVLLHNRDELPGRPTAERPETGAGGVVCVRDLEAGGSWMAATAARAVALTNRWSERERRLGLARLGEDAGGRRSRGLLVTDLAAGAAGGVPAEEASAQVRLGAAYLGFNAVVCDAEGRAAHLSNRGGDKETEDEAAAAPLEAGRVHGVANARPNDPGERRVAVARRRVADALRRAAGERDARALAETLLAVMAEEPALLAAGRAPTVSQSAVLCGGGRTHYFYRRMGGGGGGGGGGVLHHVAVPASSHTTS